MPITNGQNADESDFINEGEKDATPANDAGRVPKNEADGRLSPYFTRNGTILNCGETLNGATTPVPVYQNKTDNELYACDANDTGKLKFIGFVTSDGSDGNPARFQGAGVVAGFSGLSEGEKYYIQDTAGTLGTTPGTYEVLVGIAVSTTEILIQKGKPRAGGMISQSGTFSSAITTGFRPSVIRLSMFTDSGSSNPRVGQAVYLNGVLSGATMRSDGTISLDSSLILYTGGGVPRNVTISSVTDTGFTIAAGSGFDSFNLRLVWEAEGEL
jgi:hypothetical protein